MTEDTLANRIYLTVQKHCPAFVYDPYGGPALWHRCKCKAENSGLCECVRQEISLCVAGTWPQLYFVAETQLQQAAERREWIARAKQAIAEARNGS